MRKIFLAVLIFFAVSSLKAQDEQLAIDYSAPRKFNLTKVNVIGSDQIDKNVIIAYSGLAVGTEIYIPSDDITKAITNLWKQRLFSDIKIEIDNIEGNSITLNIVVKTRPRLSRYSLIGMKKSEADKVKEKISLRTGDIITDQLLQNTTNQISKYYIEKGFFFPEVKIDQEKDTLLSDNSIRLLISIDKGKRVRIGEIVIEAWSAVSTPLVLPKGLAVVARLISEDPCTAVSFISSISTSSAPPAGVTSIDIVDI